VQNIIALRILLLHKSRKLIGVLSAGF
jgi:hypothetical protein